MMTTSASKNGDDGDGDVPDEGARSGGVVDAILVSPYLRAIQTACPASDVLGVPLHIEDGLSESHATDRLHLPSADVRFAYFPRVDPTYDPLLVVRPTPGHACRRTGLPCESFAGGYCRRMARLVTALESTYRGRTVVLFSHAASVALVAALTRRSMRDMKFAPCGIYQMERVDDGPWTLVRGGECNSGHVRENSPTTYPWGFSEKDFDGDDGIDFDYFVDDEREKSKM
jgi:broad specificity phosphatase PhoE